MSAITLPSGFVVPAPPPAVVPARPDSTATTTTTTTTTTTAAPITAVKSGGVALDLSAAFAPANGKPKSLPPWERRARLTPPTSSLPASSRSRSRAGSVGSSPVPPTALAVPVAAIHTAAPVRAAKLGTSFPSLISEQVMSAPGPQGGSAGAAPPFPMTFAVPLPLPPTAPLDPTTAANNTPTPTPAATAHEKKDLVSLTATHGAPPPPVAAVPPPPTAPVTVPVSGEPLGRGAPAPMPAPVPVPAPTLMPAPASVPAPAPAVPTPIPAAGVAGPPVAATAPTATAAAAAAPAAPTTVVIPLAAPTELVVAASWLYTYAGEAQRVVVPTRRLAAAPPAAVPRIPPARAGSRTTAAAPTKTAATKAKHTDSHRREAPEPGGGLWRNRYDLRLSPSAQPHHTQPLVVSAQKSSTAAAAATATAASVRRASARGVDPDGWRGVHWKYVDVHRYVARRYFGVPPPVEH